MTTIEEKPAEILLHEARRTKIRSARSPDLPHTGVAQFNPMGPGGHRITIPILLRPEWGQYHPGNQALPPTLPPPLAVKISVEIEQWFQEFEDNPLRNAKGLKFSEFGRKLKSQGFTQITQLSRNFITIPELQDVLKIDMGTAIFILDYAQEDVRRFKEAGGVLYH
jgi:hypothetical protein